jgi:hypothetical protein
MPAILTAAESSRISWVSEAIDADGQETLSTFQQIKAFLTEKRSLVRELREKVEADFGDKPAGIKVLLTVIKGALGGAIAGFAFKGLGTAVASFFGLAAGAEVVALILFLVGFYLLFTSIFELPKLIHALREAALAGNLS